jgi:polysaccharide biosynthesis transport protein
MTPDPAPAPANAQRATAREFLAVLFRRRWIIIGLFSVVLGIVLFTALGTTKVFISSGAVLVKRGEQESAMAPYRQVPNDWEIELGSEQQTAKSWPVLQAAQKILDAQKDEPPLKLNPEQVDAEVTGKTNVLAIAYTDVVPRVAERACDALLRAYIQYRQNAMLSYPETFFNGEIAQASAELESWTRKRREFSQRTGVVELGTERSNLITLRSGLGARRSELVGDLDEATAQYRLMGQLRQNPAIDMPSLLAGDDNSIQVVKQRVVEQQSRILRLRERYRDDAPEVVNAEATLDTLRAMLQREVNGRYEICRSRMLVKQASVDAVNRDLADIDVKLARLAELEDQSSDIDHQTTVWQERYAELSKSSDQARVNQNTTPRISVTLLNPASPAAVQNKLDYVRLGLAPAFSLVVGVGLAFFLDGLDLTVHTSGQAEEEVRVPVLAAITERRRDTGRPRPRNAEKRPA